MPEQISKTLKPGQKWTQRFMVRRNDMPGTTPSDALFQNLLEIDNGAGATYYFKKLSFII
ncbi:MAG: hypothetical protein DRI44_03085 [Chlamydiae bacterium]|nr:MAG: hypothetical protein DRI44_03085 [Chlamydiota bacterium]